MLIQFDTKFASVLLLLLTFTLFIKKPELALAILFNGTLIYFYTVYKLGFQTSRTLTGGFYGFLACSFLLAEVLLLSKRNINFRLSFVDILFLIFFSLFFLSYLAFSSNNENAYRKIIYAPLLAIAPYLGGRLLFSERRIKNFFKYSVLIAIVLIIPAFYELFFDSRIVQTTRFSMYYFENATNPILFSDTFAVSILIIFVTMFEDRKFYLKKLLLIAIFGWFVLLGGSRGAIVSLVIASCFYLFIVGKVKSKTQLLSFFVFLFLAGILYVLIPENLRNFYSYSTSEAVAQDTTSSIYMRIVQWQEAVRNFVENPFLGIGMGNFDSIALFPHNIILEIAAEFGILGLFIFISLCYTVVRKAAVFLKKKQLSNSHVLMKVLLVLFVYTLTHAMFSGHIANQTKLYICMGAIVCLDNLKNNTNVLLTKKLS